MAPSTAGARERGRIRGPLLTVSATAWLLIVVEWIGAGGSMDHPTSDPVSRAAGWLLMLTAMMTPLLTGAVRHVRESSFARRRTRSITLFVGAYALVWLAAGIVLSGVAGWLLRLGPGFALAAGTAVGLAWQLTPSKGRCLNRVHAHPPLPAFGRAADAGALRFGLAHAAWCVGVCGALMLIPLVAATAEPLAMTVVAVWLYAERFEPPAPPCWGVRLPTVAARGTLRALARHP